MGKEPPLRVVALTYTCSACPSQWEGELADGRRVYVRFRHGFLSVRVSAAGDTSEYAHVNGLEVAGVGLSGDGYIPFSTVVRATRGRVTWPRAADVVTAPRHRWS